MRGRRPHPLEMPPTMSRSSNRSLGVGHSPGIKCNGLRSSWPSPRGSRGEHWASARNAIRRLSGGSAVAMRTRACPIPGTTPTSRATARVSALQRAEIVQLACLEPVAKGLQITHWTSQDLARQAVEDGIVPAISDRTVQAILNQVDLQPIARGIGVRLASTLTSRSVPRRSSGTTATPSGWPGGASGGSVPMKNPTSKSWNDIPSGIRSPARSRSVSWITRGTARSTSCSS